MAKAPTEFAAFIGIDWADRKHDFCLQPAVGGKRERGVFEHRPAAIEAWAAALRERFAGAPVAVALELSHGPIVSALLEHDFVVLFPSTPPPWRSTAPPSRPAAPKTIRPTRRSPWSCSCATATSSPRSHRRAPP